MMRTDKENKGDEAAKWRGTTEVREGEREGEREEERGEGVTTLGEGEVDFSG